MASAFPGRCDGVYYEPFVGSASVFLHLRAAGLVGDAVLADANGRLIAMYRAIRDEPDLVLTALRDLPTLMGEDWPEPYYPVRESFNLGGEPAVQAARLLWLNRGCFNGLYRENSSGTFNVPAGRHGKPALPDDDRIREVSLALQGVELLHEPFDGVIDAAGAGDFVYCDPPYVPISASANFTSYARAGFDLDDQRRLAQRSRAAADRGAVVVLSNHDVEVVREELYSLDDGFEHVSAFGVRRSIGCDPATRGAARELLVRIGPRVAARPDP